MTDPLPFVASEITMIPLSSLCSLGETRGEKWPNPNEMTPEEEAELEAEIRAVGFLEPILVRRAGKVFEIVNGEHRRKIADRIGLPELPCVVRDVSNDQARLLRIAFSRLRGEPNITAIVAELAAIEASIDQVKAITGYDDRELRELKRLAEEDPPPEPSEAFLGGSDEPEADEDKGPYALELIVPCESRRALGALKRKLKKIGGGDMGTGLMRVLDEWEE